MIRKLISLLLLASSVAFAGGGNTQIITPAFPMTLTDGVLAMPQADATHTGFLSAADWAAFDSGSNVPRGTLSTSTGGVTITGGTDSVIGSGTTIEILTASNSQTGLLSAADHTTFAAKQAPGSYLTALTGDVTAAGPGSSAVTLSASVITGKALTGFVSGAGTVSATDSILTAFNKVVGNIAAKQDAGNYVTALTGDVTASGPGSSAATIAASAVTNAKLATMSTLTIKGNSTGGTTNPSDLSVTTVTGMLNAFVGDSGSGGTKGLVPAPASGDAAAGKFLKADGTFAVPASGSGNVSGPVSSTAGQVPSFSATQTLQNSTMTIDSSSNYIFNSIAAASVPAIFETNSHTRYFTFSGDAANDLYAMPQLVLVNQNSTSTDTTGGGISGAAINPNGGALRTLGSVNFASDGSGGYVTVITSASNGAAVNNSYFGPTGFFHGHPAMTIGDTVKPWAGVYATKTVLGDGTAGVFSAIEQNNSTSLIYLHSLQYLWRWQFYDKTLVTLNSLDLQLDNRIFSFQPIADATANSTASAGMSIITANKTAGTGVSGTLTLGTGTSAGGVPGPVLVKPGGVQVLDVLQTKNVLMNASTLPTNTLRSAQTRQMVLAGSGTDDYYNFGQLTMINTSTTSDFPTFGTAGEVVGVMANDPVNSELRVAGFQMLANGAPGLFQFNARTADGAHYFTFLNAGKSAIYPATDNVTDFGTSSLAYKNSFTYSQFVNTIDTYSGGVLALNSAAAPAFSIDGGQLWNIKASSSETTGAGSALLGSNSPAVTLSAPFTWWKVKTSNGSTGYIPIWK